MEQVQSEPVLRRQPPDDHPPPLTLGGGWSSGKTAEASYTLDARYTEGHRHNLGVH